MAIKPSDPFPVEVVRDLLGIIRAMYAEAKDAGAGEERVAELHAIGGDLREAIRLAQHTEPGTLGHRAAWTRAEGALERFGRLVDADTPMRPALDAMARRFHARSS